MTDQTTDADTVANRAAQVITTMGAEIRALKGERDRFRSAWRSARERAAAYGDGILRVVSEREQYQEWLRQAEARAAVSSVGQAPTPNQTAAIASCPGYEAIPNPCRCPCYGCKHHCGAHNPDELTDAAPAPDRTALRDRIRRAVCEAEGFAWDSDMLESDEYGEVADAVLAELPEPTDRTAVLREAAVFVEAMNEGCGGRKPCASCDAREDAAGELHRLADAAAVVSGRTADETQGEAEAQPSRHRWYVETRDGVADQWAPGTRFTERRAALERYEVLKQHHPTWKDGSPAERRIVRETTSYTVEPASAVGGAQQPTEDDNPRTVCVCGHTRGEHVTVGGPFGRGRLLCDECDGLGASACKEFEAL